MDYDSLKPILDIGLGGVALLLYWKQGKFLARLCTGFEAHAADDKARADRQEIRDIAQESRISRLEKRRKK